MLICQISDIRSSIGIHRLTCSSSTDNYDYVEREKEQEMYSYWQTISEKLYIFKCKKTSDDI